ncbi:MAG: hypothetical protein JXQ96_07400 [Cyclobacteriaceae bacterium]
MKNTTSLLVALFACLIFACQSQEKEAYKITKVEKEAFAQASKNGELVNIGFERCRKFVESWLEYADPETGLIPRNLDRSIDIWNAQDAAADNYPFMVLTAALTDSTMFYGRMRDMLETEKRLTSRIDNLPDTYSFSKKKFDIEEPDLSKILFGSSEYIKDGLLPLTEWLGKSPWSERMIEILDDIWKHAPIETVFGNITSTNVELNGEMLQVLSRIYWMTGDDKYLEWAIRLGDYYMLGENHPTRDFDLLRLRDHGCEVVSGLCELYVTLHYADMDKKSLYQPHIYEMLDRILEVGRNEDGLFYNQVNPKNGEIVDGKVADNFGYTLNGFYSVYQIDNIKAYKVATLKALDILSKNYRNFDWERGSSDGYADAIEGALNLYARDPLASTKEWLDSEIQVMWSMQDSSHRESGLKYRNAGVIEGWHGDGNFARTTIMYCLWKSQGVTVSPWRSDLKLGAVMNGKDVLISISSDAPWKGKLIFDTQRHNTVMQMPYDWPRINQFPEWFTPQKTDSYDFMSVENSNSKSYSYDQLVKGVSIALAEGQNQFILRSK